MTSQATGEQAAPPQSSDSASQDTDARALRGIRVKVRIGSRVVGPDGDEQIGTVEKVVISPKTREVTHLLVHRGPLRLLHNDVMVPIAAVSAASEATVRLSAPVDMLNRMAGHDERDYITPAAKWEPPGVYKRDDVLFALPPASPATALYTPPPLVSRSEGRTEETQTEPEGVVIGTDTKVEAADGPIGSIDRVLLDPDTGRVTHFVVRKGQFLTKHVLVPVDWAAEITPERISLAVDREQLAYLPEYRPDDEIAQGVFDALKSYPPLRRLLHGVASYDPPLSRFEEDTVRVMVQDGVVTLEGVVQTGGHASMAAWLAQQVPGVRQVRNLLVADEDLEIAVASALSKDERTRQVRARVESNMGIISLIGLAPSEEARIAAEKVASDVLGVRRVVNKLSLNA
ncbi:MAG TPA: BON domain-containing protein [Chloroflexia bacterium]|nr:BON domain-containing protein [Chloroflexia bacterium]